MGKYKYRAYLSIKLEGIQKTRKNVPWCFGKDKHSLSNLMRAYKRFLHTHGMCGRKVTKVSFKIKKYK